MEVAEEIIWKRKAWDKSYMKMMENQYDGMTITPSLQKRIIFGFLENETDIHLRPLTKLQQVVQSTGFGIIFNLRIKDTDIFISNVVMHGFTTAHAITAMALVQTVVGYEAALTTLTIITIVPLSKILLSFV